MDIVKLKNLLDDIERLMKEAQKMVLNEFGEEVWKETKADEEFLKRHPELRKYYE